MLDAELRDWRKTRRKTLFEARAALGRDMLRTYRQRIDRHLLRAFPNLARGTVAITWPFRGEYDTRHLAHTLRGAGARIALPVVIAPRAPLEFRAWAPGVAMAKGVYDIPYPAEGAAIRPDALLIPMLGFDRAGYRLGYGGGYYDRTLAALAAGGARPAAIGIAYELAAIDTIHPQPFDVPMEYIVTERGLYRRDPDGLVFLGVPKRSGSALASPVCYASEFDEEE